jgi:DNA repair ATPase RecN
VNLNALNGHIYSEAARKEIDSLLIARKNLLRRVAEIDSRLAQIQKDGAAIKTHCQSSLEEIRAAAHEYEVELDKAAALEAVSKFMLDLRPRTRCAATDGREPGRCHISTNRSRMLAFLKKSAADQQANSQGATPAQPSDPNATIALPKTAPPSARTK